MDEKIDPKKTVSFEELPMSNTVEQEALINLLEAKGIIKKQELLDEIKRLKKKSTEDKSISIFWIAFFSVIFFYSRDPCGGTGQW